MTISVNDNKLTIICDKAATKVYIDSVCNSANVYSMEDDKHDHSFKDLKDLDTSNKFEYEINLPEGLDMSAFTVTANYSESSEAALYYDTKELYYKEVNLLTEYCNTCLDKQQKEKLVLFILKQQLFQYAIENNLIDDQIAYYKDLARMLKIEVKSNMQNILPCAKCACTNGVCSLC